VRKFYDATRSYLSILTLVLVCGLFPTILKAQQLKITDFVLFGGTGTVLPGQRAPLAPGYGVQFGSSSSIQGGSIGSFKLVKSTGNAIINGNIYSGSTIQLANSNVVKGKLAAGSSPLAVPGTVISVGSNANLAGRIDANGNIVVGSGTVSDSVIHSASTTYSGPNIGLRNRTGTPTLPTLPVMPEITGFTAAGSMHITSTIPGGIGPGSYGNVTLGGNKTLTFNGPGDYVFNSITNSGTSNDFVFDFQNLPGTIKIYVWGNVDLSKVKASIKGGGDESRVYLETHGDGTPTNPVAFNIANGSSGSASKWVGTVWAPFAAINIGSGTGSTSITGALWSGTQVNIQSGVTVNGINRGKVSTIIGAELTSIIETVTDEAKKVFVILDDNVLIEVIAKVGHESEVVAYLISEGMTGIVSNGSNTLITTGKFPRANLLHLNTRGDIINFCRPVFAPLGNSGLIKNAGDTAIGSHLVRNGYDLQGQGIKIGVISDSYNTLATPENNPASDDISSGDLPGVDEHGVPNPINSTPVQVLLDYPYGSRSDEGRAMLQIVHDIAPKAELAFRTGFISPGDFAVGIQQLQEAGCKVIVDDITYINEPFLRDGTVANMVDLVKSLGVTYVTSAGNFSDVSQEQGYRPVAAPAGFAAGTTAHDFSGTGDIYQRIKLKTGLNTIALQWDDDIYSIGQTQAGGTINDFDFFLTDLGGNIISAYNRNNTFGDPFEFLAYTVPGTVTEFECNILITRANTGTITPRFKYIIFRADAEIMEHQVGASTIIGHANAAGAIAVGAINYFNTPAFTSATPAVAFYSSIGGTSIGGADRHKPEITAPDNVNTSVNMGADISQDADPFSNFRGTSAAAPHAAAVAALLIEGSERFLDEAFTPDGVKNLLQSTALNIGAANAAGAGLIQADLAMRSFASPKPALISLEYPSTITPTSPPTGSFELTVHGDYFTAGTTGSEVQLRGVAVPTTFVSTTELTAIIPAFTDNPSIRVYTPPIANGDGGHSNSVLFFSNLKTKITVTADHKTKKYGEQLPVFTSTIMVGTVPLSQSGLTLQDIGLENLTYSTNATLMSNVSTQLNQYLIKPVRTFNPTNPADAALLELYTYDTVPGTLTIEQLPVQVIANDLEITYGQDIPPITFTYIIDTAIAAANPAVVNNIRLSHEEFLATDVVGLVNRLPVAISNAGLRIAISNGLRIAISNGGLRVAISNSGDSIPIYNAQSVTGFDVGTATVVPYTLTPQELANLSFYATEKSLASTRQLTTNTRVVDIAQESILNYNTDPALTTMVNTVDPSKPKGILGAEPIYNNRLPVAISNGGLRVAISNTLPVAISNGGLRIAISNDLSNDPEFPISNGGLRIAISNSLAQQADRIAVIIDQTDVDDQTGIVLRSLNAVTGLSPGTPQFIIPGSVLNNNYLITYGLGDLIIYPAAVTVKANDTSRLYGDPNPVFNAAYSGLQYGETLQTSDITGAPSLTTPAVQGSPVGIYDINASAGTLSSANYTFNSFQRGRLTIGSNPCLITRSPFTNFGSTANPGTATSLWLNIETKVSGQLTKHGDYLLFGFGTVTFNNITSSPTVTNTPIPAGKIEADSAIKISDSIRTRYYADINTWITKVPVGFSSTSDIFITGVIINASGGFVKKNQANSVVKGIFYSNRSYSDQWTYAIAAYQPQFTYSSIDGLEPGLRRVQSINGNYRAGTPIPFVNVTNPQLTHLVNGGSGGGGNNYTGSTSSFENYTACLVSPTNAVTSSRGINKNTSEVKTKESSIGEQGHLAITPNPADNYADISFVPFVSGNLRLTLFAINGVAVKDIYNGLSEATKTYRKRLDINSLPSGIYLIQLQNGEKREIRKLIIAR